MFSAIKLVIIENGKLLDSVAQDTGTRPAELIKSLEEFQRTANEAMTKIIQERDGQDSGDCNDDTDENEDEPDEQVSPRKKKK